MTPLPKQSMRKQKSIKLYTNSPDLTEVPRHIPLKTAILQEWDGNRSLSQPPPKHDNPESIPQTLPKEQINSKTHSPITYNTSPKRPVKERLGKRPSKAKDHLRDEAPRRPLQVDINANLQNHQDRNLPPKEKSGIKTKQDTGIQTKMKTPMNWEVCPLTRRGSKIRNPKSSQ